MKLWTLATFCAASLLILSGCGAKVTPKKEAIIDDTLPVVHLTKNGTIIDMNAVALEWSPIEDPRVKGVYVYKITLDEKDSSKNEYYDTIGNRFSTHYLDTNIKPDSKYNYYFKTFSSNAESRRSEITLIESLPLMDSVTWIHSIQNMPRSAKIIWRPHTNEKVKLYEIQRRTLKDEHWQDLAKVEGRLHAEFIDKKLKDNYTYIYRIRAVTYDKITSKPSKEVRVITKALPDEVTKIYATTDMPRKIEIKWEKTQSDDFSNYNLYRSPNVNGTYKILSSLQGNSYVDMIEEDGKQYFYRVSVVDKDGLESIYYNYSIQGTTLIKPKTPSLVEAKLINGKIKISWSKADSRTESYTVQKRYKKSIFESSIEDFENIKGLEFIDREIEPEKVYYYKIFGVDANGIKSEPSIEVELKTQKMLPNIEHGENIRNQNQNINVEKKSSNVDVIAPIQDFN